MRPVLGDRDLVVGLVNILGKNIHSLVDRRQNFVERGRTIGRLLPAAGLVPNGPTTWLLTSG
jgi:hypothetical protein